MNKILSILFLFLYALILAHTVVPHHHHQSMVCIKKEHCANNDNHQTSDGDDHQHHKGNNQDQSCILKQPITPPYNKTSKIIKETNCKANSPIIVFALLFQVLEFNSDQQLYDQPQYPVIQSDYSVVVSRSSGLRAPPIV